MNIDKVEGIKTRKKWFYNNFGEKIDFIEEVYLIDKDSNEII